MKLSLKFQDADQQHSHSDTHTTQIMTAKVPISIFSQPFISCIRCTSATSPHSSSDFSFSISTNLPSGPSLKLSYSPTSSAPSLPFSLSLKSGLGIFGSPRHSPLVFSANFSLSPSYTPIPAFFLHFKPQFGNFSLNKTVFSDSTTHHLSRSLDNNNNGEIGNGFLADGSSSAWQELKLEPCGGRDHNCDDPHSTGFVPERSLVEKNNAKYGLSPGVAVMARTVMPVTKGFLLNLRWGVNFPANLGLKLPFLTVNKIGLERVVEEVKQQNKPSTDNRDSDLQQLKGMLFWMRRDLEIVEKENRDMKRLLEEMKMEVSTRNSHEGSNAVGKKFSQHSVDSSSEFERRRSKKNGRDENEQREPKKSQSLASDVESELQKAIKAASASS